mgnify:CR=1 FL=1
MAYETTRIALDTEFSALLNRISEWETRIEPVFLSFEKFAVDSKLCAIVSPTGELCGLGCRRILLESHCSLHSFGGLGSFRAGFACIHLDV